MWTTVFKIKKLFSKVYKNTKNVYESIYNDVGAIASPVVLTGANGIGGGNFGSYIDISSKITNNNILDIQSNSKDESFITNLTHIINESNMNIATKEVTLYGCNYCIVDLYYFFVVGGGEGISPTGGVYFVLIVDGVTIYNSSSETTYLARQYEAEGVKTSISGHQMPGGGHMAVWSNFCREYSFNSPKTVRVVFYLNFSGYNRYMASTIEGVLNVTSLKATNDITRDIYATVIEQVDPTIN